MLNFIKKLGIAFIPAVGLLCFGNWYFGSEIKIFGFMSYYYFIFTLLVSPVSVCLRKIEILKKIGVKIIGYRRALGIITGVFAFLHIVHFEERIYDLWQRFYVEKLSYTDFIIDGLSRGFAKDVFGMSFYAFVFGVVSGVIILILSITSNNFSQRKLGGKAWKSLQKLAYPLFITLVLHIYFIGGWKGVYLYPAVLLIVIRLYVFFGKK